MEALEVALPSSLPSLQLLECLHLLPDMLPAQNLHGCGGRALSPGPPAVGVASTGGRVPLVEALQLDGTLPLSFRPGASSTLGARSRASLS